MKIIPSDIQSNIQDMTDWCNELYDKYFREYFDDARQLFKSLNSKTAPITNIELEWILIDLPIRLFSVSEALNTLRTSHEVVKISIKQKKLTAAKSASDAKDSSAGKFIYDPTEDEIALAAYASVVTRVENEISFSRELIMGAKKVWDSRRQVEASNPISEVEKPSLPEYNKSYANGIKPTK